MKAKALIQEVLKKKDVMRLIEPYTVWVGVYTSQFNQTAFVGRTEEEARDRWNRFTGAEQEGTLGFNRYRLDEPLGNTVWVAILRGIDGHLVRVSTTEEGLTHQVAEYVRSEWEYVAYVGDPEGEEPPANDAQAIHEYFTRQDEEILDVTTHTL